jgi:NADP-dependent 3-hydroxy acid dehydrogenase YdfG
MSTKSTISVLKWLYYNGINEIMSFSTKTIWITGASSGIGKALALELSNQNAKIILSSRKKEDLERVKSACKNPSNVKIVVLDLEQYINLQSKVDEALDCFGTIDILVNNGGISQRSFVKDTQI